MRHWYGVRRWALVLAVPGLLLAPPPAVAASRVVLTDAIAPGRYAGQLGLGPGPVVVARGSDVTYAAAVNPPLPGESVTIWTRPAGGGWRQSGSATIAADGTARTFLPVGGSLDIQARLTSSSGHQAASSPGRRVTVGAAGHAAVNVACSEVGRLAAGSILARAAAVAVGETLAIGVCGAGGSWSIAEADRTSLNIVGPRTTSGSGSITIAIRVMRPGSGAVRLVRRATTGRHAVDLTLVLILAAPPLDVSVRRSVPFTPPIPCGSHGRCAVAADIFAPRAQGPWPVVVFLRGGPGGLGARTADDAFARGLAAEGVVVYNADYRDSPDFGGRFPRAFDTAACAVRFARATAARFGGEAGRVTLVGHSLGAYVGSVVALSADRFASACLATGRGTPDTFVGIAGPYDLGQPNLQGNFAAVLGGTRAQVPYVWRQGDPFAWVRRRTAIRFRLVQGSDDPTVNPAASQRLAAALTRAGFDSMLAIISGASHVSVLGAAKDGDWTRALVLSALR